MGPKPDTEIKQQSKGPRKVQHFQPYIKNRYPQIDVCLHRTIIVYSIMQQKFNSKGKKSSTYVWATF